MDKILVKTEKDLQEAIEFFGKQYENIITEKFEYFPCVILGAYSDDIETGSGYEFEIVYPSDFN